MSFALIELHIWMKNTNYSFVSASTDAFREVKKYSVAEKVDLSNNPVAIEHIHMKLFRAQRNEYIAGFALLLCLWVFSPCLSHFLNISLFGTGALAPVSEHDQLHVTVWLHFGWPLPADFWKVCKQNFTWTLLTGSLGSARSVPEECIYKKMYKLFHCNCVILQYPQKLPAS